MSTNYTDALWAAMRAARIAGAILLEEFHRPDGPRGEDGHAPVDTLAEQAIRAHLLRSFPKWSYRGEETGFVAGQDTTHLWLVDPNDGTSAFLRGFRGSAVSIALLRDGLPVLGVVFAFAAPDDEGDLFGWAEGVGAFMRNGQPVVRPRWPQELTRESVVLVSPDADRRSAANERCVAPARFRAVPSIAYRLALVAAGDADAAVSLNAPGAWDYAAGHALLRGVGGVLLDEHGREVSYTTSGESHTQACFGGAPAPAAELSRRPWRTVFASAKADQPEGRLAGFDLVRLQPGWAVADAGRLARAQGCLLGQLVGDALGSLVEFRPPAEIRRRYPDGVRVLHDGGHWNTIAGQPTDDSELTLMLARSIVAAGGYDREASAQAYVAWYRSGPFDVGNTIGRALGAVRESDIAAQRAAVAMNGVASTTSQSNGSLMRMSPLGIWGAVLPSDAIAAIARQDSALTHPHLVCQEACAVFVVALGHAIAEGLDPRSLYERTVAWAEDGCRAAAVVDALHRAAHQPPADYVTQMGWVLIALQNAFYQLLHASSLEEGIVQTAMAGGDTDTNGAIVGALLGAAYGRDAVPLQWRQMVLSCRPLSSVDGVHHPRPRAFWPVDALELAERLLLAHPAEHGRPS